MKIESVRLLHAQGVPDHYIANQVYQPIDDDHRQNGSFFILFDHQSSTDGTFTASLINTLIREYYRQNTIDRLSCFEQTLVRMNDQIKQFTASRDGTKTLLLNGVIVLYVNDEIHITYIGTPVAYLFRKNDAIPLVDAIRDETSPESSFSVITSGEVYNEDKLILITRVAAPEEATEDLTFSLSHQPLYEATRAYARILKQKYERASEALFVRFNQEDDATFQVYVDKSLETTGEKLEEYKKSVAKHASFIASGVTFLSDKAKRKSASAPTQDGSVEQLPDESIEHIKSEIQPKKDDEVVQAIPSHSIKDDDTVIAQETNELRDGFEVRNYREKQKASAAFKTDEAIPKVTAHTTIPHISMTGRISKIKSRTLYILGGAIIILVILIRVFNSFSSGGTKTSEPTVDREAITAQAEAAEREAEAAQIQNQTSTAISKLLEALAAIQTIPEKQQNEKSKAVANHAETVLDSITKTVHLTPLGKSTEIHSAARRVVVTSAGTYLLYEDGSADKFDADTLKVIEGLPVNSEIHDAVAFDDRSNVAFATQVKGSAPAIFTIDKGTTTAKSAVRVDHKDWPESRLIASFGKNLYIVGQTMIKATPSGDKYKVTDYIKDAPVGKISSIANNGFAFYAIEEENKLSRIAANSPKTAIKYYGVPDAFLPKTVSRLISSRTEGTLYLFDATDKRIIELSTDGAYRRQFVLPTNEIYSDCDIDNTTLVCTTNSKKVETFSTSSE
jgi:hypothetical protein